MARSLTVNNIIFSYPEQGNDPAWGEDAVDWAEEVTTVLNSLQGSGDILQTSFTVANNQSSAANVTNLLFDSTVSRAAFVEYSIYRESDSTTSGKAENGVLYLVYDDNGSSGNKWLLSQEANGDSGAVFAVGDTGQVTYTSSDIGSTGYSGAMRFRARTLDS